MLQDFGGNVDRDISRFRKWRSTSATTEQIVKATADLKKMMEATQPLWKFNPLSRPYGFMKRSVGASGGLLEHDHSKVALTGCSPM